MSTTRRTNPVYVRNSPAATDALRVAGHLTQTLVAVLVLYYLGRLVVGMVGRRKKDSFIVGSSAPVGPPA